YGTSCAVSGVSLFSLSTATGAWASVSSTGLEAPTALRVRYSKPSSAAATGSTRPEYVSFVGSFRGATRATRFFSTPPSATEVGSGWPTGRLRPYSVTFVVLPGSTTHGWAASIHGAVEIVRR